MTECLPCELRSTDTAMDLPPAEGEKAYWSGPIGFYGEELGSTGDGRSIKDGALRVDTLPIPLRWVRSDVGAHDGAVVVGRITKVEHDGEGRYIGFGDFDLGSDDGREAYRQVKEGLTQGVSMDLDDIEVEETDNGMDILAGRIRAATLVAIPAFEGARIAITNPETFVDEDSEDVAPVEDDETESFNWVDEVGGLPAYIKRIEKHLRAEGMTEGHAIATAVNAVKKMCATGDLNFPGKQDVNPGSKAEACAAVAEWEEKKARARASNSAVVGQELSEIGRRLSLVASAAGSSLPSRDWFGNPGLREPTALTVTPDGRVYGHLALWGTCHIGNPQGHGVCTQPPRSASNYSYFLTGVTETSNGDVATGHITMDTLHAGARLAATDTARHYEHTGAVAADVAAGEDAFGIWVAGSVRPGIDVRSFKAAPISGDWRTIGGHLELVAALSVNVPGFPVPRAKALVASGAVTSLVASGLLIADANGTMSDASTGWPTDDKGNLVFDDKTIATLREKFRVLDKREKVMTAAAKIDRMAKEDKIRRVAAFAGNQSWRDQWRMPKGNNGAGQWILMPDALFDGDFAEYITQFLDGFTHQSTADDVADAKGDLETLGEQVKEASEAIRAFDGDTAVAKAQDALKTLEDLDVNLNALNGFKHGDDDTAYETSEFVNEMHENLNQVAEADMSFLGEEVIGADEGGDIGDETVDPWEAYKVAKMDAPGDISNEEIFDQIGVDAVRGLAEDASNPITVRQDAQKWLDSQPGGDGDTSGIPFNDLPASVQEAFGDPSETDNAETFHESERWPGLYEARYEDGSLSAVADANGYVASDATGGHYVIYTPDGGTSGLNGHPDTIEGAADALAEQNGITPIEVVEAPVPTAGEIDFTDLPAPIQEAFGDPSEREVPETFFESERWPGMYEARYEDGSLSAVADADGNVASDASGGHYVIYNKDGSTSGRGNHPDTIEGAADALAERNGVDDTEARQKEIEEMLPPEYAADEIPDPQTMKDFLIEKGYGEDVVEDLTIDELIQDYVAEGGLPSKDGEAPLTEIQIDMALGEIEGTIETQMDEFDPRTNLGPYQEILDYAEAARTNGEDPREVQARVVSMLKNARSYLPHEDPAVDELIAMMENPDPVYSVLKPLSAGTEVLAKKRTGFTINLTASGPKVIHLKKQ